LVLQHGIAWLARHWLFLFNGFWVLFLGGIFLTPLLMLAGFEQAANALYTLYGFTCHQLPDRSYFFGGEMHAFFSTYDLPTLVAHRADATNEWTLRAFDGTSHLINDITGWGFRDTNAWAVWLTHGAFPAGFYTGTEIWSLNWWLRTITGILFGVGVVWFAYPLLHEGMQEIAEETRQAIARTQKQLRIQTRG